jgi:pyrroloquinoline quinone biosynthesis protein D
MARAGRICPGGFVTDLLRDARPTLAAGCRLDETAAGGPVLLMPERALRLNPPGLRILQLCDGKRTISEILLTLCTEFPVAEGAKLEEDTLAFLERLRTTRAIDLE